MAIKDKDPHIEFSDTLDELVRIKDKLLELKNFCAHDHPKIIALKLELRLATARYNRIAEKIV